MGACLSSEAAAPKAGGEVSEDSDMHRNLVKKAGKKAEDAFDMGIQVGKGSASKIVLVSKRKGKDAGNGFHDSFTKTSQNNPGQYAIKLYDGSAETPPDLEREAEILRLCDHPNIVKLFELSTANNRVSLVLELCTGGTALDRMPLKEPDIRRIMRQLVSAVAYLHNKNIVHRDIELANILFEDESLDSDIKLIDFGCATRIKKNPDSITNPNDFLMLKEKTGSVHIMAPEVVKGTGYAHKADMWSVGVCAYMLLTNGQNPFLADKMEEMEEKITKSVVPYHNWEFSKDSRKFVQLCLAKAPAFRISAVDALRHEWLNEDKPKPKISNQMAMSFALYGRSSPLKRIALNALAKRARPQDVKQYRQLFRDLDVNQSGTLTKDEFFNGFDKLGMDTEELESLFKKLDVNMNGVVTYTEFIAATLEAEGELEEEQIEEAFELLDEDSSGKISTKNLLKLFDASGPMKEAIEEMLKDHQEVDYETFAQLFEHGFGSKSRRMDPIMEASLTAEQVEYMKDEAAKDGVNALETLREENERE